MRMLVQAALLSAVLALAVVGTRRRPRTAGVILRRAYQLGVLAELDGIS